MHIEIHKLTPSKLNDFMALIKVFEDVFEMKNFTLPRETYLRNLLHKPGFMVFVAKSGHSVIGGLTAYVLDQYYAEKPLAYIYDLAVKTEAQRQGIGQQLISAIKDHCRKQGFEEVFVQADRIDKHAVDFYRKTRPAEEEDVLHFYYSL